MRTKFLTLAVAAATTAACATPMTASAADTYVLDTAHTFVQFSVDRFGFNAVIGEFRDVTGEIILDKEAPAKSAVSVEIRTDSLISGDATRDEHLKGPFWFNIGEFPVMSFSSSSVETIGENEANVAGELLLHGVRKPVTLHVKLNKLGVDPATKGEAVGFSATAKLKRSDFGMNTAAGMVGDEIDIRIETFAHRGQ